MGINFHLGLHPPVLLIERLNKLPSWQKKIKKWNRGHTYKNIGENGVRMDNYRTDINFWLCTCPHQKKNQFFFCKHLPIKALEKVGNNWKPFLCYISSLRTQLPLFVSEELKYGKLNSINGSLIVYCHGFPKFNLRHTSLFSFLDVNSSDDDNDDHFTTDE